MELTVIRALVICFGFLVCTTVLANDDDRELAFYEILSQQEEQEYQTLINNIKSMDDVQYRAFLTQRINQSYANKHGSVSGFVVVDVTEEINQPEPGFFAKLFLSPPSKQDHGVNKVQKLLGAGQTENKQLKYQDTFSLANKQHKFQQVEGNFNKQQAMALVAKKDIVDLHITDSQYPTWSQMTMFDSSTGRVLPPKAQKEYSDEFLSAGLYKDLMKRFEKTEKAIVSVNFHSQKLSGIEPTVAEITAREQEVENFLYKWNEYDFEVLHKSDDYVFMETNKLHVEAMKDHPFVSFIRTGDGLFINMIKPSEEK